jgi:hypothetical protein
VPHSAAIKRALNRRLPLSLTEPKAGPMAAYRDLARRVAHAISGTQAEQEATHVRA